MEEFAELAAAHEKILLILDLAHGPETNAGHAGEVDGQNKIIDEIHNAEGWLDDTDLSDWPNKKPA